MKSPRISSRRFGTGAGLVALTLLTCAASATSAGGLDKQEIVAGKSIGYAALGMTRETIQHKLKSPRAPERSQDGPFYYLTYRYPYENRFGDRGDQLTIAFHGLSRGAHAVYMITLEYTLATREGIHVGSDRLKEVLAVYPGANCYHSNPDDTRDPDIDDNENSECEVRKNGGFTYFSFASRDVDPQQHVGTIAVATRRVD